MPTSKPVSLPTCCNGVTLEVFAFDNLYTVKGATRSCTGHRTLTRDKAGVCKQFDSITQKCSCPKDRPLICRELGIGL